MKKLFFLFSILFIQILPLKLTSFDNYSIVYVHIGPTLPQHLKDSINQALLFNKCHIYVISSKAAFENLPSDFPLDKIVPVACESLPKSRAHLDYLNKCPHRGFWLYTTERFFYLDDFLKKYNLKNIFHLENDVMIYVDLSEKLAIFEKNYSFKIGATFDSDSRCIAGFLYIAEEKPLDELCNFIAYKASLNASYSCSDMYLIGEFKKDFSIYIDSLPIVLPQYAKDHGLINLRGIKTNNENYYSNNIEKFHAIFDAAAIGQYLGGLDSIHSKTSTKGFINETCLFNPSCFSFSWEKDSRGRLIPYMSYKYEKYPIINLHIHSKNLKEFYSKKE